MIRKVKEGWVVLSHTGKRLGGPYKSEKSAKIRLNQVEKFKHAKKK